MEKLEFEAIIIKYLNNEATEEEITALKECIIIHENRKLLESYTQTDYLLNTVLKSFDSKEALLKFNKQIKGNKPQKLNWFKKRLSILKYAAVIAIVISTTVAVKLYTKKVEVISINNTNEITLELSDGTVKVIHLDKKQNIINKNGLVLGEQDNNKIVYKNLLPTEETLSYNKLYVPYGKKFQIELSDGTLVHLNAGSTLKYPVGFIKGMSREVFLDGEAYFIVSKDKDHSFIVNANDISTEVYGTEFNISSYKADDNQDVVLVEGSVGVYSNKLKDTKQDQVMLTPNKKASFDKDNQKITSTDVEVYNYVAWKDGVLMFENERFENILRKLERHYDISIQNNFTTLNNTKFTGIFDIETIDQVLQAFQKYREFNYELTNKKIIINH